MLEGTEEGRFVYLRIYVYLILKLKNSCRGTAFILIVSGLGLVGLS